jgi:hypothetical protein
MADKRGPLDDSKLYIGIPYIRLILSPITLSYNIILQEAL